MTIKFYVAEGEFQCPEEDADFVRYADYKRLKAAAKGALEMLGNYDRGWESTWEKGVLANLKKELEG